MYFRRIPADPDIPAGNTAIKNTVICLGNGQETDLAASVIYCGYLSCAMRLPIKPEINMARYN